MTAERDPYEDWDAAYVLGALSSAERREYETHLRGCERCAAAVAELAAVPPLLARVPADEALALLAEDRPATEPAPDPLPGLLAAVRTGRRRRRWWAGIGAAVAAAVAALLLVLSGALRPAFEPVGVSLEAAGESSPLSADVELVAEDWGTRVEMTCSYRGSGPYGSPPPWRYALTVTSKDGEETVVSSWEAGPGETVHTTGTVDLPIDDITSIAVRSTRTGDVLLSARVANSSAG
ncbi:zf-HC2 domain-containing protein [Naasia sp. SYSU D00057]|uniref:zf-HC2 domain-containing protein n=1 Tax=Naasia sp. SYSU D00057 TaxID=2817380 RepID=UPI001B303E3B|nr:zf-HC2 domain-containing protein [Naasia sp. SYSU D00057]